MSLRGKRMRRGDQQLEMREVWGKVKGQAGMGCCRRGLGEAEQMATLPSCLPQNPAAARPRLALLSQPRLPPPRKQAACARVNTVQVINCLQQLAPVPGPAEALALEEAANYSFINIHAAT